MRMIWKAAVLGVAGRRRRLAGYLGYRSSLRATSTRSSRARSTAPGSSTPQAPGAGCRCQFGIRSILNLRGAYPGEPTGMMPKRAISAAQGSRMSISPMNSPRAICRKSRAVATDRADAGHAEAAPGSLRAWVGPDSGLALSLYLAAIARAGRGSGGGAAVAVVRAFLGAVPVGRLADGRKLRAAGADAGLYRQLISGARARRASACCGSSVRGGAGRRGRTARGPCGPRAGRPCA